MSLSKQWISSARHSPHSRWFGFSRKSMTADLIRPSISSSAHAYLYLIEKKSYHSYQHIIQIQTRRQEKALKMFQMELGWSQIVRSLFQSPTCQYFAAHRKHRRRHAWEGRRPCTHGAWDQPIIVENLSWKNPKTFDQFCNRSEKKFHHLLRFRTKITSNKRDLY